VFPSALRLELAFLAITLAAAAAHLWAMNYAYFAHARIFYAAPVGLAAVVVLVEALAPLRERRRGLIALSAVVPLLGLALSGPGFDVAFPLERLPAALRDPRHALLLLTAAAWWYGWLRLRSGLLLHAGSAAAAVALLRMITPPGRRACPAVRERRHRCSSSRWCSRRSRRRPICSPARCCAAAGPRRSRP
jgi:hypothetical protein